MAIKNQSKSAKLKTSIKTAESRSLSLAERGPTTLMEIAEFTMAVACDVIRGAVTAGSANATATNVGKTLKSIEMQLKYGPKDSGSAMLAGPK